MLRNKGWFTFAALLGALAPAAGCGGDETTGGAAGMSPMTSGGDGGVSGFGGGAQPITGGSSGSQIAGLNAGGGAAGITLLGAACDDDLACGVGLKCLLPDSAALTVGGPPNGLCTASCSANTDCSVLSPNAGCYKPGLDGHCVEGCRPGAPSSGTVKCHDRTDFACAPFSQSTVFLCVPMCASDQQCGKSLYCDPRLGECVATEPIGAPAGTACDPTGPDPCRGFCLGVSSESARDGVCAEVCSGEQPCMYSGGVPGGGCYGQFSSESAFGAGDIGFCNTNCSCTSDCQTPGDICRAWKDVGTEHELGAPGLCYPILAGKPELVCGGDGGEGGAVSEGGGPG